MAHLLPCRWFNSGDGLVIVLLVIAILTTGFACFHHMHQVVRRQQPRFLARHHQHLICLQVDTDQQETWVFP